MAQTITDVNGNLRDIYASNWQDAILRTAITTDNNFSVRANVKDVLPLRAFWDTMRQKAW